jgi:uncharacterized repeat protein (TIGR01451 family)/CSLREA domain-containing protein
MRQSKRLAALAICLLLATLTASPRISAATFTVNSTVDSVDALPGDGLCADVNGNCTLRAAVQEANALPGADTIILWPGTYLFTIPGNSEHNAATGDLDILDSLTITGAGAANTVIDANGLDRVFEVINAGNVTISGVTLQNGVAGQNQNGYSVQQAGGAIFHVGTPSILTLSDMVIRNCAATTGGAVYNVYSTLVVRNSTFYNNSATAGDGGGIAEGLADYVQLSNTTLSGNRATGSGGALLTSNNTAILNNVTIVDNIADSDNNGSGDGGGIALGLTAPTLSNTIVANNSDPGGQAPDCSGSITSLGYNLIGINTGCTITASTGDVVGTASAPRDPHLSSLIDNGGTTPTHAILNFSPALNTGNPATPGSGNGACEPTDQRGVDRAANAPCDKGAFEHVPLPPLNLTVNSTLDEVDASPGDRRCETAPGNNVCTLRAAIQEADANIGDDTITVPAGNYLLTIPGTDEAWAASGDLNITDNLTITGAGAAQTIIDGNGLDRVFDHNYAHFFTISGVTIRNGNALNSTSGGISTVGGGIRNFGSGITTVNDSVISGNTAVDGGGLYNTSNGVIVLNRTTISGNTATSYGGGVCNFTFATTRITDSTIKDNTGGYGGGLFNSFMSHATITGSTLSGNGALIGGAITTQFGSGVVSLLNSTLSGNHASTGGGAIRVSPGDTVNLNNTTLTNNRTTSPSAAGGGGIYNTSGTVNLSNSLIAGNLDAAAISPDCDGNFNSNGYNLIGDDTGCTINTASGDLAGSGTSPIDPHLGPLTDNGGFTFTHALLPNSPALNAGNPLPPGSGGNACEALDQRGIDRTINANCDIGAVETRLADLGISQIDSADPVLPNGTVIYTVTVNNNGPDDASSLVLIDTLPTGATLISVTSGNWSCDGNSPQLTCTLPVLAKGQTSTVSIMLSLPGSSGIHTNSASVSSATLDLNAANNSSSETTVVDAAPVVSGLSTLSYTTGDPAVTIAPAATITDSDSSTLNSAVIQFTSGYQSGTDLLSFTGTATLTGAWDAGNGTLTLSGTDSVAAYQDALRHISFQTGNNATNTGQRVFSVTVNDGSFNSTATSGSIAVMSAPTPAPTNNQASYAAPGAIGNFNSTDITANTTATTAPDAANDAPAAASDTAAATDKTAPDSAKPSADDTGSVDNNRDQSTKPDNSDAARASSGVDSITGSDRGGAGYPPQPTTHHDGTPRFTTGTVTLPSYAPLWRQLDNMKQQMQGALEERPLQERIAVGAAKGATLIAFAGTVNWVLKGSNFIAGMLSSLPLWTQFDPLAVLTLTRRERKRRLEERRADARRDDAEYSKLGALLERRRTKRKVTQS